MTCGKDGLTSLRMFFIIQAENVQRAVLKTTQRFHSNI